MNPKQLKINIPVSIARPASVVGADAMLQKVNEKIAGLKARIEGLDLETTPGGLIGPPASFVFNAESSSFMYDVEQLNGNNGSVSYPVNFIVRSGQTYLFPVNVGGRGVFLAHRFRITLRQRLYVNGTQFTNLADGVVSPMTNSFFPRAGIFWTTKFSCFPCQPQTDSAGFDSQNIGARPSINYWWNIQDPVTGEQFCNHMMPASSVLNRNFIPISLSNTGPTGGPTTPDVLFDGDWREFAVPWRFDKAHQLNIHWRPVTDIIQFDSSILTGTVTIPGLPYDDRISGRRNQAVTVQVEFQGERIGR